ncbi:MFS transporter [Martelella radicis]|uniref:MFS family permease n=1 Tax=Martelella radicis TaxID=1397476 RepID=A0A7W6PA83_9HYPH|nr:MFS transporter [Martelella radicis]MBB4121344.1 MFS family permease [Martelella radicis]
METEKTTDGAGATLIIVAAATCLALVVFTAPLTTLNAMTESLGLSPGAQAWAMSGMPLGAAVGLLTAGALGDSRGRRETFLGGLWLTALSSVVTALAPNATVLIIGRVVQGLGSAGIMACGLGLIGQVFVGERRKAAAAVWAAALGTGVAAGPIIASLMLFIGGWRADHVLIAVVSAVLGALAMKPLPKTAGDNARIDILGSLLLMAGLGALLSAMTEIRFGLTVMVSALLVASVAFLSAFVVLERRVDNPIIQLELFRRTDFVGATIAAFASGAGVLALMTMVPTMLERAYGMSPLTAAVVLLAWSGITAISPFTARFLPAAWSSRSRVLMAMAGCLAGQLLMLLLAADAFWGLVLPGLFVAGISNGILNGALGHASVESVPAERAAMGSAANNTARYLGSSIGIAISSVLISAAGSEGLFFGWYGSVLATSFFSAAGILLMFRFTRRAARA